MNVVWHVGFLCKILVNNINLMTALLIAVHEFHANITFIVFARLSVPKVCRVLKKNPTTQIKCIESEWQMHYDQVHMVTNNPVRFK